MPRTPPPFAAQHLPNSPRLWNSYIIAIQVSVTALIPVMFAGIPPKTSALSDSVIADFQLLWIWQAQTVQPL